MWVWLPTLRIGLVDAGATSVGVSTTGWRSSGSPSSSWIVPMATVSQNSAASRARATRPKP